MPHVTGRLEEARAVLKGEDIAEGMSRTAPISTLCHLTKYIIVLSRTSLSAWRRWFWCYRWDGQVGVEGAENGMFVDDSDRD